MIPLGVNGWFYAVSRFYKALRVSMVGGFHSILLHKTHLVVNFTHISTFTHIADLCLVEGSKFCSIVYSLHVTKHRISDYDQYSNQSHSHAHLELNNKCKPQSETQLPSIFDYKRNLLYQKCD